MFFHHIWLEYLVQRLGVFEFSQEMIMSRLLGLFVELVSKELNHFGVIAAYSGRLGVIVVDLYYFALFEMIKSVKVFPFSF